MTFAAPRLRHSNPRRKQVSHMPELEILEDRNLLSASPSSSSISFSGIALNTSQYSTTDILVQFKPTAIVNGIVPTLPGTSVSAQLQLVQGLYDIKLAAGMTVSQALAAYQADAQVVAAEPDYALTSSAVPNNPDFSQQTALQNTGQSGGTPGDDIGATQAWDVTTGNPQTVVAVMDTGIDYDQQDLYENIWINQAEIPKSRLAPSLGGTNPNGIQDYYHDGYVSWQDLNDPRNIGPGKVMRLDGEPYIDAYDILAPMVLNAQGQDTGYGGWAYPGNTQDGDTAHPNDFIGWNFVDNNNNPLDQNGHGTNVAGIIGAMGNSGVGVSGVDWQVSLMDVQFLGANGTGTISTFITALNYAVDHGAKISNNSWSGADNDPLLESAINNARQNGMIFVAAAGNNSTNTDVAPAYPSSFNLDNIISVAAVDDTNHLAPFSNYGATSVDLAAPGVNILSTLPNNTYGEMSGTSMAAPMVTGVVALVWGEHPSWTYLQVIDQVLDTVTPVAALQGKVLTGGVLNAARAVGYVAAASTPATPPPQPVQTPTPTSAVTPTPSHLTVVSSVASGNIAGTFDTICLTFSAPVNPSALNNTNVTLVDPNGQHITISNFEAVPGSGGTQIDLIFPTQLSIGSYYLLIGAGVESQTGATLATSYQKTFQLDPVYVVTSTKPVTIPEAGQTYAALTVQPSFTIGQIVVQVNMVNSVDGKVSLYLQSPDGTKILLSNLEGDTGRGFFQTLFDDQSSKSIGSGQAPFAGSYQPESQLGSLAGKSSQGTWNLIVVNQGTNSQVILTSWSLIFTEQSGGSEAAAMSQPLTTESLTAVSNGMAALHGQIASTTFAQAHDVVQAYLMAGSLPGQTEGQSTTSTSGTSSQSSASVVLPTDAVFMAVNGVDRLAELRVMMPHANQTDSNAEDMAGDESSDGDETEVLEF